jgi:hypothetical protein
MPTPRNSYFDALCCAVQQAKHSVWLETCAAQLLLSLILYHFKLQPLSLIKLKCCRYIIKNDALADRLLAALGAASGDHPRARGIID